MENEIIREFNYLIVNGGVYEIKERCKDYCKSHPSLHCYFVEGTRCEEDLKKLGDINIEMVGCPSYYAQNIPLILKKFPCIKWIHSLSAGVENFFKVGSFKTNRNIIFSNSKGACSEAFGEGIIAAMLYFSYNIPSYIEKMKNKQYERMTNEMLYNKTLLIYGYGNNGISLAKRAKLGFGMKVTGVLRTARENFSGSEYADKIYSYENLPYEEIKEADFVFATLPSTKDTLGIFNKHFFDKMNKNAIFINIGRGNAVIEEDLVHALKSNKIRGAILDVSMEEPRKKESELYNLPPSKLLLTNHSIGVLESHIDTALNVLHKNIEYYLKNGKPITLVNKEIGY